LHHRREWVDLAKVDQPAVLRALVAQVALVVRVHLVRLVPAAHHAQVSQILVRLVPALLQARLQALLAQAQARAEVAVAVSAAEQPVPSVEVAARETVPESQSARNAKSTSRDRLLALVAL
jgi:molybdopterin-guanine dinucleotide biosynthesis protein A